MNITEVVSCVIVVRGSLGRRRSLIKTLLPKHGVAALLAKSHPVTSFHLPRNSSEPGVRSPRQPEVCPFFGDYTKYGFAENSDRRGQRLSRSVSKAGI